MKGAYLNEKAVVYHSRKKAEIEFLVYIHKSFETQFQSGNDSQFIFFAV